MTEKDLAEDYRMVLHEAESMGCNKIKALYNIPLKNMEMIVQALEKQIPKKPIKDESKQLAEWLEDYKRIKMLIPIEQALKAEHDKAIDDFIKAADKHCGYYTGECRNLTRDDLLGIANNMKLRSDG